MFYVYEWYVKESGEIIYVGKGTRNRYKVKKHNRFFDDFIKRFECESRIVKTFESEKEAFEYEYKRINELKEIGQCVCNIYNGGKGGTTEWWTPQMREKYSQNNVMKSEKRREKMSKNNPMKDPQVAKIVGEKHKRKVCIGNKIYDGLIDVSREYNVNSKAVLYWIERGYSKEQLPCYYYGEEPPKVIIKNHYSVKVKVIVDEIEFSSIREASQHFNFYETNLGSALKKGKTTFNGHTIRYGNQQPSQGKSANSTLDGSTTNE